MKKWFGVLVLSLSFCMLMSSTVLAKEQLTKENFDYEWYLVQHPDVAAAIGADKDAIWNFYETIGKPAGWLGRPSLVSALSSPYLSDDKKTAIAKMYEAVDSNITLEMSQEEKARTMHDWLCNNTDYDYSFSKTSYSYVGTILYGQSVCQGYAEAYDYMMQLCGISSTIISGTVDNGSGPGGHAWNELTINGVVSYVDVTWDDFTKDYNYIAHDCFMISEAEMNRIHDGCVYLFTNGQPQGYVKRQ